MAKAGHAIGRDRLKQMEGVSSVPCVIHCPHGASDGFRGVGSGRRARMAVNGPVAPRGRNRVWASVHGLFQAAVALAVTLGVACGTVRELPDSVSVEFGARIVLKAGGKGLGTMAKAGHAIGRDRLLCTAG